MYVGFSSALGSFQSTHYLLGWSFKMNGTARDLDYDKLPPPLSRNKSKRNLNVLAIWLPIVSCSFVVLIVAAALLIARRRLKYAELLEDWELQYRSHRFSYKDLFRATQGFKERELLETGGFGRIYRGVLPASKKEVAIKKVSHVPRQGMKAFVTEIVSICQMRHPNLVQLLGYCRRKGELLLVYDFMPHGSLDKFLYDHSQSTLSCAQRFQIAKGVASGLLYLHEGWTQVVIHRDIKASNVLLDSEMNGRLGGFVLPRLYDHGTDPLTSHVPGTTGYVAPELARTGKATTATDVFAFGVFLLEVACGRRPVQHYAGDELVLMDWVLDSWRRGLLIETMDPRLGEEYCAKEVELVLKLGLLCSHPIPTVRPNMRQVTMILDGDIELPELSPSCMGFGAMSSLHTTGFDDYAMSFSSSAINLSSISTTEGR